MVSNLKKTILFTLLVALTTGHLSCSLGSHFSHGIYRTAAQLLTASKQYKKATAALVVLTVCTSLFSFITWKMSKQRCEQEQALAAEQEQALAAEQEKQKEHQQEKMRLASEIKAAPEKLDYLERVAFSKELAVKQLQETAREKDEQITLKRERTQLIDEIADLKNKTRIMQTALETVKNKLTRAPCIETLTIG